MSTLRGSMVAVVTPMIGDVAPETPIDWPKFKALIDFHVAQGTRAIVATGTTGESATLSEEEHCEALRRAVEFADKRIPVIDGTGAHSTPV